MAKTHNTNIRAHPGFQNLFGFVGRYHIEVGPENIYTTILYFVGALKAILEAECSAEPYSF
jgi:lactam utilization protein B